MNYIYLIKVNYSSEGSQEEKIFDKYRYSTKEKALENLESIITHGEISKLINYARFDDKLKKDLCNPKIEDYLEFINKSSNWKNLYVKEIHENQILVDKNDLQEIIDNFEISVLPPGTLDDSNWKRLLEELQYIIDNPK